MKSKSIEFVGMIAFMVLLPVALVGTFLGFRVCWQCHETKHILYMKKYEEAPFENKPKVCKKCHCLLSKER